MRGAGPGRDVLQALERVDGTLNEPEASFEGTEPWLLETPLALSAKQIPLLCRGSAALQFAPEYNISN